YTDTIAQSYLWYLNNNLVSGINANGLRIRKTGTYNLIIQDLFNCRYQSNEYVVVALGTYNNETGHEGMVVYPIPATDLLNIKSEQEITKITVTDLTGKLCFSTVHLMVENENKIDISKLANGMYFIVIETTNGNTLKTKFIKQ